MIGEKESWAKMDYKQIEEELCKYLEEKRYLVVIDDLWKVETWERISPAFPKNNMGSRIILTTRKEEVALHAIASREHHHELRLLDKDEIWELFCRKVFLGGACPDHLLEVGTEIVGKCGGLPLAIVVIGGLLMGKARTVRAWSKVRDSAKWQLSQDSNLCRETLYLSYNDLPHHLKSCFLYLGLFPEDYEIEAKRLILLWVSEGFVQARGEENTEDVAEDCLEELIQRSMIQVSKRKYLEGPVLSCRIHDLLRDLAVSEGRKDKFMDFHASSNHYSMSTTQGKLRRFAIHSSTGDEHENQCYHTITTTNPNLRSLILFQNHDSAAMSISISCHCTKMLRVMDMSDVNVRISLPKEIGNLFFLHYLRLSSSKLRRLPNDIDKLVNLQTLDLRYCDLLTLPKTIWKLKNLRHLYLNRGCTIPWHVAKLCQLNDFGRNLLTLRVGGEMWMAISDLLVRAEFLQQLFVDPAHEVKKFRFPLSLIELSLGTQSYPYLRYMSVDSDLIPPLGSLPKLKSLTLSWIEYPHGETMIFHREGFPQLEFLDLFGVDFIEWIVEEGALPSLRDLSIVCCDNLKKLPDGLKNVTSLQRITIGGMPEDFTDRVKQNGEDWEIIKHVPAIHIGQPY